MNFQEMKNMIENSWSDHELLSKNANLIKNVIKLLDSGELKPAEKQQNGEWKVNEWVKKAILLFFKISPMEEFNWGRGPFAGELTWVDKIPLKFEGWKKQDFLKASIRATPGSIVRFGSHIGENCVLMPSFVNIGASIGSGTMIDTWATVGSCAQIGKNCHISGGVGIGGVLEPISASPVIIEDDCFIGARSEITEGVIVRSGSVISMGVYLSQSTKIIDRETGEIFKGEIPANSVVVPGSISSPISENGLQTSTYAAIIVKKADDSTRGKTATTQILRQKAKSDE